MNCLRVSTHSRLKAAGAEAVHCCCEATGFNTQPPEGGWSRTLIFPKSIHLVSTHSRLKAAGASVPPAIFSTFGFNTQPPEGGWLRYKL